METQLLLPSLVTTPCDRPACQLALEHTHWALQDTQQDLEQTQRALEQTQQDLEQTQRDLANARHEANYYRTLHQHATRREAQLRQQLRQQKADSAARFRQQQQHIADLQAEIRLLKQRLYGSRAEGHHRPNTVADPEAATAETADPAAATADPRPTPPDPARRPRGHQPGQPGHGRRHYDHLPAQYETAELPPEQQHGSTCGRPFARAGSEPQPTTLLEVDVRAHRRIIRRQRYRPTWSCGTHPPCITAPVAGQLIPRSQLGLSIWVQVLLDK